MVNKKTIKLQAIDVSKVIASNDAIKKVPSNIARRFGILPLSLNDDQLRVVLADPDNFAGVAQIESRTGLDVEILPCRNHSLVDGAIERYYPQGIEDENSPLGQFELIVNRALQLRSSDIHLDPEDEFGFIRMRIDGLMRVDKQMPIEELLELVSAIKVSANLDIAEKRVPQDGQIVLQTNGAEISMRVATIPTIYGEKVTLRILSTDAVDSSLTTLDGLGMQEVHSKLFRAALNNSDGVILLSGPTGSGKTTTLYAALRHLKTPGTKHILSIEDPVEIPLDGINQVHVDSERVSFNKALRSTLRHDPDIIMIGEIRDSETADIAVKSALTGHLVLSTLHANDSLGVITRLLNLGVSKELVTSSLRLVIAQRLVRRPCEHCLEYEAPNTQLVELAKSLGFEKCPNVPATKGCEFCGYTGYSGRVGLYEMIPIDRTVREQIRDGISFDKIADDIFTKRELPTVVKDGLVKVFAGETTFEEVCRVTYLGSDA